MSKVKLTIQKVRDHSCPAGKSQLFLWDTEVRGLAVRALPARMVGSTPIPGAKSFIFQGRVKGSGQEVRVTLGRVDELPLAGDDTHAELFHFFEGAIYRPPQPQGGQSDGEGSDPD